MKGGLDNLFARFKIKGFLPIEIPDLVKDAFNLMGSGKSPTINDVDHELEDLGWGIGIMDNATFELITYLLGKHRPSDIEKHIHSL